MSKGTNNPTLKPIDVARKKINDFLKKSGIILSSEDMGKIFELAHTIHLMNYKSVDIRKKASTKLIELKNIIESNPRLGPNTNKLLEILTELAPDPETRSFINKNYFNEIRDQYIHTNQPMLSSNSKNLASDNIIFIPESYDATGKKQDVDPIIQAIRDEILIKQKLLLQAEIAKGLRGEEKEKFLEEEFLSFRYYLKEYPGNQTIEDLVKRSELMNQLHDIEREGYNLVHSKFMNDFHDVDWGKYKDNNIRTTKVKHDDGSLACVLKETTVTSDAQEVYLANGKKQVINQYRKIDFPQELELGNGPMHASMAVMDVNGNNISENEAVYFTAHYNSDGKLMEISSPAPVRFAGKGNDAIGYIEVNNRIFTIPVTKGKYIQMIQEVAKNNQIDKDQTLLKNSEVEKTKPLQLEGVKVLNVNNIQDIEDVKKEIGIGINFTEQKVKELTSLKKQAELIKAEINLKEQANKLDEQSALLTKVAKNIIDPSELEGMARKMSQARKARGNEDAEPEKSTIEPIKSLPFAEIAERMRQTRKARGNEDAEPASRNISKSNEENFAVIPIEPIQVILPTPENKRRIQNLLNAAIGFNNAVKNLTDGLVNTFNIQEKEDDPFVNNQKQLNKMNNTKVIGKFTKLVVDRRDRGIETDKSK